MVVAGELVIRMKRRVFFGTCSCWLLFITLAGMGESQG